MKQRKHRCLSLLLALTLMLGLLPGTAWAAEGALQGSGTAGEPYLIADAADLKAFRDLVHTPLFAQSLEHVHLGDFSTTRKVTLLCVKLRFYYGVYLIAKVRHWQFRKFAGQ